MDQQDRRSWRDGIFLPKEFSANQIVTAQSQRRLRIEVKISLLRKAKAWNGFAQVSEEPWILEQLCRPSICTAPKSFANGFRRGLDGATVDPLSNDSKHFSNVA